MTDDSFERRMQAAIEARQSLEILAPQAGDPRSSHARRLRREQQLDEAILAWKRNCRRREIRAVRIRVGQFVSLTAALGVLAACWYLADNHVDDVPRPATAAFARMDEQQAPPAPVQATRPPATTPARTLSLPERVQLPATITLVDSSADPPRPGDARAQSTEFQETASRLAYAIEPMRQQVGAVVQRLIDAVPGADIVATWTYES